jgi:aconitate hydratase
MARQHLSASLFQNAYHNIISTNETWNRLPASKSTRYAWDGTSTYIRRPPFYEGGGSEATGLDCRILALLGDSVTTDHISPAGSIPTDTPAGAYLLAQGISKSSFNSYGSRRGNHEVMMRGTFANIRIRNRLTPEKEGGWTRHWPDGGVLPIFDACQKYQAEGVPLVVIAGAEYGTGSSRDWAAKGTALLGVRMVLARSYERIHRSNLVGMGVLPLQFPEGESAESWELTGTEIIRLVDTPAAFAPGGTVSLLVKKGDGTEHTRRAMLRLDSEADIRMWKNGGILKQVLQGLL